VAGRSRSIEHDANLFSCTKPALHSHLHRLRDRQPCAVLNHASHNAAVHAGLKKEPICGARTRCGAVSEMSITAWRCAQHAAAGGPAADDLAATSCLDMNRNCTASWLVTFQTASTALLHGAGAAAQAPAVTALEVCTSWNQCPPTMSAAVQTNNHVLRVRRSCGKHACKDGNTYNTPCSSHYCWLLSQICCRRQQQQQQQQAM
jgi:hypothetical protein